MTTQTTRWSQFGVLITVFFFWGFVAASNDILIPVFKKAFNLTQAQSQYVAVAFYDGELSSAISFQPSVTADADRFARERIAPRRERDDAGKPRRMIGTPAKLWNNSSPVSGR